MQRANILAIALALCAFLVAGCQEETTYYHTDALGSPVAATDDEGELVWEQHYGPWGTPLESTEDNALWYTGAPLDDATDLTYLQARWYSAGDARFLAADAVDFQEENVQSFNRYAYANNNPYTYVDPDGSVPLLAVGWGAVKFAGYAAAAYDAHQAYQGSGATGAAAAAGVNLIGRPVRASRAVAGGARGVTRGGVQANRAAGEAFERQVKARLRQTQSGVVDQVTVRTQSGVRTRLDLLGRDASGAIRCTECKSSATAPLTRNQRLAFPEIQKSGGVVVGRGKPGFPGGAEIPPTQIEIIRP